VELNFRSRQYAFSEGGLLQTCKLNYLLAGWLASSIMLSGCGEKVTNTQTELEIAPTKNSEVLKSDVFVHPLFIGLSEICLPYMSFASGGEANLTIEKLTKSAGFRKGLLRNYHLEDPSRFRYSIGNIEHGSEILADSSYTVDRGIRSCTSMEYKLSDAPTIDYPSIPEFTSWLQTQDHGWELLDDELATIVEDKKNFKATYAVYCKSEQAEFQQVLKYYVSQGVRRGANSQKLQVNNYIDVKDVGQRRCSDFIKR